MGIKALLFTVLVASVASADTTLLRAREAERRSEIQHDHITQVHIEELTRVCYDKIRLAVHEGQGWTYVDISEYEPEEYNPVQHRLEVNGYYVRIHEYGRFGRHMDMNIYWRVDDFKQHEEEK